MPVGRGGIAGSASLTPIGIIPIGIIPIGIILLGAAPAVIYRVTMGAAPAWLTGAVIVAQVTALVWLSAKSLPVWSRATLGAAALALVGAALFVLGLSTRSVGLAAGGICHAAAYASLLFWFARSLRPDREPVVTGFARRMRRTMPVKVVRYTRLVTIAWCVFFAAQLGMSAALLAWAPDVIWPAFVSLLNLPLIAAMILAEFSVRLMLFRHEHHTGLIATLAGLRHIGGIPGSRS
jgi:uncharacterized membrane protein